MLSVWCLVPGNYPTARRLRPLRSLLEDRTIAEKSIDLILSRYLLLGSISFSGCVTTFTPTGQFQVGLSASANETVEVLADFEASEESAVAGDLTKKAGSSCAGGVCTIY